jgi:hypothetical protein
MRVEMKRTLDSGLISSCSLIFLIAWNVLPDPGAALTKVALHCLISNWKFLPPSSWVISNSRFNLYYKVSSVES